MPADEFFVGYLPTPSRQKRFLWTAGAALLLVAISLAAVLSAMQRDPGDGSWNLDQVVQFEGVLHTSPYPMLETASQTLLLVSEGKFGASDRVLGLNGQSIRANGYLLNRKGLPMLELESKADALQTIIQSSLSSAPPPASNWKTMTVQGEIVDSKCFAGAMKPGDGKTHKACASLCIRGGVPPMLICFDSSGKQTDYLLVDMKGDAITGNSLEALLPFVGDPVEVTGDVQPANAVRAFGIFRMGAVRRIR